MTSKLAAAALAVSLTQVGKREDGTSNWSVPVKAYLAAADIHEPAPWCASFVNWCAEQAAKDLGLVSPLEAFKLQGYVPAYVEYGKKHNWVVEAKDVLPGDLFCLYESGLGRYGHIGFVTRLWPDRGYYTTVEGNSNVDGSRDGYAVVHRQSDNPRPVNGNVLFLRYSA